MKVVLQRVTSASVAVEGNVIGQIKRGLLLLVGLGAADDAKVISGMAEKIVNLRIFNDADGRMNLSVKDVGGALLVVSQFTLYADCRKGRRPSYVSAAPPHVARKTFAEFVEVLRNTNIPTETGVFQASMEVSLTNDGPVTIVLDSNELGIG